MAALICSIVEIRRENTACLTGLLGLFAHMSRYLNRIDRIKFAECLRDVADDIERVGHSEIVN